MNRIFTIMLVVVLSGCATYEWRHVSGKLNANQALSECDYKTELAYPLWLCPGWPYCTPAGNLYMINYNSMKAKYKNQCMTQKGFRKYLVQ